MNKRERAKRTSAFARAVRDTEHMTQHRGMAQSTSAQDQLALWQESKSKVVDKRQTHPITKGDQEYFEKLDLRDKRYSQGGLQDRLRGAAFKRELVIAQWDRYPVSEAMYRCF